MLFFVSLVSISLCDSYEVLATPELIKGIWNCTRVEVTSDGYENPDTFNFSVVFQEDSEGLYLGSIDNTNEKAVIKYDSKTNDISFKFREIFIQNKIVETENNVRNCHGAITNPNWSYSLVIMSSYRVEFTIFDRDNGKVIIYRMMKKFSSDKVTGFVKFATYLARKMIFKLF